MTVVRVRNQKDVPFVDAYDGTSYTIDPAGQVVVPVEAAKLWFGDWESHNDPARAWRARDDELERLKIRYGAQDNPEMWEAVQPRVAVLHLEEDDEIITLLGDPAGDLIHTADVTVSEHENMLEMIRQQSRELQALKNQYKADVRAEQPDVDVDEDKPQPVASKRARRS